MPSDQFYGSADVEVLYPNHTMNSLPFSESDWNPSNIVSSPAISRRTVSESAVYSFETQAPLHPSDYENAYSAPRIPPPIELAPLPGHVMSYPRPKSSPSTFGPNVEDLLFPENPYRIKGDEAYPNPLYSMSPIAMPQKAHSPYLPSDFSLSTNLNASPNRAAPIPIAPDPAGLRQINALKRMREDEEHSDYGQKKRKRTPSQAGPIELNEEEQLLLKLKEDENLPWKDIATRFQTDLGKSYQVPALQMRFKRLRERMRSWTETDVQALEQAYDYWEKFQFDIIAAKMLDFGASERWPAKYCARKWEEIHPGRMPVQPQHNFLPDPWETVSPADSTLSHSRSPMSRTL